MDLLFEKMINDKWNIINNNRNLSFNSRWNIVLETRKNSNRILATEDEKDYILKKLKKEI